MNDQARQQKTLFEIRPHRAQKLISSGNSACSIWARASAAIPLIAVLLVPHPLGAQAELAAMATPECVLPELTLTPPAPWYSVPIEDADKRIAGCQLIWESEDQYMGIMRLVSFDLRESPKELADWENFVIGFESLVMDSMNFSLGTVLWKRESVPVSGEGFGGGKAIALEATLQGTEHVNEAHFVLFEGPTRKYVVSILTPPKAISEDVYLANTQAMGQVMRTLQPR